MLHGMTVAEASSHSVFLLEEDGTERLWQVWLNNDLLAGLTDALVAMNGGKNRKSARLSFDQFKAERTKAAKAEPHKPVARPLRPGEEADRLDFAAQFVKFKEG